MRLTKAINSVAMKNQLSMRGLWLTPCWRDSLKTVIVVQQSKNENK